MTSALHLLTFATPPFPCYILGELYDEHFDAFVTPLKDIEGALASSRTRARAGRAARAPRGGPAQAKEVRCLPSPPHRPHLPDLNDHIRCLPLNQVAFDEAHLNWRNQDQTYFAG